jgi:hypothetical protein
MSGAVVAAPLSTLTYLDALLRDGSLERLNKFVTLILIG